MSRPPSKMTWKSMKSCPLNERVLMLSKHGAIEGVWDGEEGYGYYWRDMMWIPYAWCKLPKADYTL